MAIIKKNTTDADNIEKREFLYTVVRATTVEPLQETVWIFLKKLKLELLYDPAIPLLSVYPKKQKY